MNIHNVSSHPHIFYVCPKPCETVQDGHPCQYCDGGLASCIVCGAFEGELLTHCPGYKLNQETLDACYSGNVHDFTRLRSWKAHGYDIRKKQWSRKQQ